MKQVFIVAGEVSGDTHGSGLMRSLQQQAPEVRFQGLGGPLMRKVGGSGIEDWVETAGVVGLWEVLKMYRYFKDRLEVTVSTVLQEQPESVILVDYPGFNLRLAKALRKRGYQGRLVYYISPQVWAWKKGRIKTMAEVLDLMICIFPFEKELYERSGLRTEFAGHPMVDRVEKLRKGWERERDLIGWFPGSRRNEVKRLFPVMLEASRLLRGQLPQVRFAVAAANQALANEMGEMAEAAGMPEARQWIEVGAVYDLMQRAHVGAVASGTATLEAACLGLPYALVYQVAWPTYVVGKTVVRIEHLGIVNILAGRTVVPELVQHDLTPEKLAQQLSQWMQQEESREALLSDLRETVARLGEGGAYDRAARAILTTSVNPV